MEDRITALPITLETLGDVSVEHRGVPYCATSPNHPSLEGRGWNEVEAIEDLRAKVEALLLIPVLPPRRDRLFPSGENRAREIELYRCDLQGPDQFQRIQSPPTIPIFYAESTLPTGEKVQVCSWSYREAVLELVAQTNQKEFLIPLYQAKKIA